MGQMPSDKLLRPNIPGDPHFRKVAPKLEFTQPNALGKPKKTSKVAEVTAHPLPAVVITPFSSADSASNPVRHTEEPINQAALLSKGMWRCIDYSTNCSVWPLSIDYCLLNQGKS